MTLSSELDITLLLDRAAGGDADAERQVMDLVYGELRRLADVQMGRENPGHTLQPTALVHEAWLKLIGGRVTGPWQSRQHFFATAAQAMRRILVDSARQRLRIKRGGGAAKHELRESDAMIQQDEELLALHEALEQLQAVDPLKAQLVELRFFGGLTNRQVAEQLELSLATVERYWSFARAWLKSRMET